MPSAEPSTASRRSPPLHPLGRTRRRTCSTRSCSGRRRRFAAPMVLLSIELRDRNRIVGHLRLDEPSGALAFLARSSAGQQHARAAGDAGHHKAFTVRHRAAGPALAVRAFATIPLIAPAGRLVGAMSLLDLQPQTLTASQLDLLLRAGRRIAEELASYYQDELAETDDAGRVAVEGTMGGARAAGADRPRHRAFQPSRGRARARTRGRPRTAHAGAVQPGADRCRPLQAGERSPRACGRR